MKFKDQLALNPLFIIAVLFLALIKNTEAVQCTADQISSLSVNGCDCQKHGGAVDCPLMAPQCGAAQHPNEVVKISRFNGGQILWGEGCIDANFGCNGCYLWFSSLCQCLKAPAGGDCTRTMPLIAGNPIWALLSKTAPSGLITTSQKLPGILQLDQAPEPDAGWQIGQFALRNPDTQHVTYTRDRGALAMNSVATRTEEQIHIHVCDNPTSNLRTVLSTLQRSKYTAALAPVPSLPLMCQVAQFSGTNIEVAPKIFDHLKTLASYDCDRNRVGAGLITDIKDYSWACVTTGNTGAEELFCHFP